MTNLNTHAQSFTIAALDLDPSKKDIISWTHTNLHGKNTHHTVWEIANAWITRIPDETALYINAPGKEPGDAWLITRETPEPRALHFFYPEDSTGPEHMRGRHRLLLPTKAQ